MLRRERKDHCEDSINYNFVQEGRSSIETHIKREKGSESPLSSESPLNLGLDPMSRQLFKSKIIQPLDTTLLANTSSFPMTWISNTILIATAGNLLVFE